MLPTKKSIITNKPYQYNWLIYGAPKIGKSTFVSKFNDPLFIATEDRLKALSVYKLPEEGAVKTWQEFVLICGQIKEAINKNQFKWETIVVDTVDNLIQLCITYICQKNGIQYPSDIEYGKGWALIHSEFFRVINHLSSLGKGLIFVSHESIKNVKTRSIEYTKIIPSITGKVGASLIAMVDIVAHIGFDKDNPEERIIELRGNESLEAGDTTGTLPPIMPFDYNLFEEKFKNIAAIQKDKKINKSKDKKSGIPKDNTPNTLEEKKIEKEIEFDFEEKVNQLKNKKEN